MKPTKGKKLKTFRVTLTLDGGESKIWIAVTAYTSEGAIRKAKRAIDVIGCEEIEDDD